jgi:hypothetical protein
MPMLLSGVVLIDGLCIQQVLLSVSLIAPWFWDCSVLGLFPFPRCRWYPSRPLFLGSEYIGLGFWRSRPCWGFGLRCLGCFLADSKHR